MREPVAMTMSFASRLRLFTSTVLALTSFAAPSMTSMPRLRNFSGSSCFPVMRCVSRIESMIDLGSTLDVDGSSPHREALRI